MKVLRDKNLRSRRDSRQRPLKSRKVVRGARPRQRRYPALALMPVARFSLLAAMAVLASAGVLSVAANISQIAVERVSFAGDIRYSTRASLVARVDPHLEPGFFALDLAAIKHSVEQEPWVMSASVQRDWPWSLKVTIEEQTPIAFWGDGALLNHRGEVFVPATLPADLVLPTLEGPASASAAVMQAYQLISQLLVGTPLQLSHLLLDEQGEWLGVTTGGVGIRLGRKQPVNNMKRFLTVYRQKLQDRFADVKQVDTRYNNGIAVAWREVRS